MTICILCSSIIIQTNNNVTNQLYFSPTLSPHHTSWLYSYIDTPRFGIHLPLSTPLSTGVSSSCCLFHMLVALLYCECFLSWTPPSILFLSWLIWFSDVFRMFAGFRPEMQPFSKQWICLSPVMEWRMQLTWYGPFRKEWQPGYRKERNCLPLFLAGRTMAALVFFDIFCCVDDSSVIGECGISHRMECSEFDVPHIV